MVACAATAIALFGAGTLTVLQTFTMLAGSRLGASFIVLVTGLLYAVRGKAIKTVALDENATYDGVAVAGGRIYVSLRNGLLVCIGAKEQPK